MSILPFADAADPHSISYQDEAPASTSPSRKNAPYLYTVAEEKALLQKACKNDQSAKQSLILAEKITIDGFASLYAFKLHQRVDAAEFAQRVYFKLLEMDFSQSFQDQTSSRFRHFVMKMMKNMFIDITRRHITSPEISFSAPISSEYAAPTYIENLPSSSLDTEGLVAQKEKIAALLERLYAIPRMQQETFIARFLGDSTEEAAGKFKISQGSIKTHMARSLAAITFAALPGFGTLSKTFMKAVPLTPDERKHYECIEDVRRTAIRELSDRDAFIFSSVHLVRKSERVAIADIAEALKLTVKQTHARLSAARRVVLMNMDPHHRTHPFAEKIAADNGEKPIEVTDERRDYLVAVLKKAILVLELRRSIITDDEITRQNFPEWISIQKRLAADYNGLKIDDLVLTWMRDCMMEFNGVHGRMPHAGDGKVPDYPQISWALVDAAAYDYYYEREEQADNRIAPQGQPVPC